MMAEQDPPAAESPWQQAKSAAAAMNLQACMEDLETRYYQLKSERDTLQKKIETMTAEQQASAASQSALAAAELEKEQLQSNVQQEEIKSKGLVEEKSLLQERMDRMQVEADQLREELR